MNEGGREGLEALRFLYRFRKWIIVIPVSFAVIVFIISSFLTPIYRSTAIVFPPAFNSAERMIENPQFGYNIEADRLIQMGESAQLKDSIAQLFNLAEYYQVDLSKPDGISKLGENFDKDLSFERTKYMSVEISVRNKDANLAADIANRIVEVLTDNWNKVFKLNLAEGLQYAEKQYVDKQNEISILLDSIDIVRTNNKGEALAGIRKLFREKEKEVESNLKAISNLRVQGEFFDYDHQMEIISEELLKVNAIKEKERSTMNEMEKGSMQKDTSFVFSRGRFEGAVEHEKYLKERMQTLKKFESEYNILSNNLDNSMIEYHALKLEYERMLNSFEPYVAGVRLGYLEDRYKTEETALGELKKRYENVLRLFYQPLPKLFVIEKARPNHRMVSPSIALNVVLSIAGSLAITILVLLFREKWDRITRL